MLDSKYEICQYASIIEALKQLNKLNSVSMTLFVIDDNNCMVGTLTDGDVRRALIKGISPESSVRGIINRDFKSISSVKDIKHLREFRAKGISLVPLIDSNHRICDVIDLTKYRSVLPVDAVLMAGGKRGKT